MAEAGGAGKMQQRASKRKAMAMACAKRTSSVLDSRTWLCRQEDPLRHPQIAQFQRFQRPAPNGRAHLVADRISHVSRCGKPGCARHQAFWMIRTIYRICRLTVVLALACN